MLVEYYTSRNFKTFYILAPQTLFWPTDMNSTEATVTQVDYPVKKCKAIVVQNTNDTNNIRVKLYDYTVNLYVI